MSNKAVDSKVYANAGNEHVLRHIPNKPSTILDVGCGAGDNARILASAGHTVDGITLSPDEARQAKQFCRNVFIHNLENGFPEEVLSHKYDFVICSHVLEHICFPEKLLGDVHRCLDSAGLLIVALPNIMFIKNRWNLLRGRFDYQESGLMDNTHFRWYTYHSAPLMLKQNRFSVQLAYVSGFLPLGIFRRKFPRACIKIDKFLCSNWPGLFGWQMIFLMKKDT